MDSILENLYANRELHSVLFDSICTKYRLTHTEMLVLLFLRENISCDTATDIVEKLKIAKSHVSASVRDLEERGYLKGNYEGHNRRTIHLQLCDNASEIVTEGETAQNQFLSILCKGFSEEEKNRLKSYVQRMTENANEYLRGQNSEQKQAELSRRFPK